MKRIKQECPDAGSTNSKFKLIDFKNINGEGVVSKIGIDDGSDDLKVLCGNDKLM